MKWLRTMPVVLAVVLVGAMALPIQPTAELTQTTPRPIEVVWIGDSYTAGCCGIPWGDWYATVISKTLGWTATNLAHGGTGYIRPVDDPNSAPLACGKPYCPSYTDLIDDVAALAPDVVVVSGGRNEVSLYSAQWESSVGSFFARLRAALPDAEIVATSPIWDDDPAPAPLAEMRVAVREAVEEVGGVYVDLGAPLLGRPDYVVADGVHPNSVGHAALAAAFLEAYQP